MRMGKDSWLQLIQNGQDRIRRHERGQYEQHRLLKAVAVPLRQNGEIPAVHREKEYHYD